MKPCETAASDCDKEIYGNHLLKFNATNVRNLSSQQAYSNCSFAAISG